MKPPTLLEALITVTEAARQMPIDDSLRRALKRVDQKIELLQVKDARLRGILTMHAEREEAIKTERVIVLRKAIEQPLSRPGATRVWVEQHAPRARA